MANLSNINNKFIVESDGDVGIGVTTALDKLNVGDGNIRISHVGNVASQLILNTYQSALGNLVYNWFLQQTTSANSYSFQIGMGPTPYLHINSVLFGATAGNIGIGNNTPLARLTIGSSQGSSLDFSYDSGNGYRNNISNYWNSSVDTRMDFNIGRTANVAPVTVMSVGYNSNVGIGTTSPNAKLEVASGQAKTVTSGVQFARFGTSNEASNYATLTCEVKGAAAAADRKWIFQTIESGVANAGNIVFQPSGGNIGIGTDSPGEKLEVDGNAELKGNLIINKFSTTSPYADGEIRFTGRYDRYVGGIKTYSDNASYPDYANGLDFFVQRHVYALPNGHRAMRITSEGNVAIGGTFGADSQFRVELKPSTTILAGLRIGYANTSQNYYDADEHFFRNGIGSNPPVMKILGSGNVGIGVASPVGKLQVSLPTYTNEDTNSQQAIFGVDSGYGVRIGYNETDNKGYINVLKPGVAWGSLILQEDVGKVGIGTTTPDMKIDVEDSSTTWAGRVLNTNAGGAGLLIRSDATNNASVLGVYGNGSYRMLVQANGNVGIGTTSPQQLLHINEAGNTTKPGIQVQGGVFGFTLNKSPQSADYVHLKPLGSGPSVLRVLPNTSSNASYIEAWGTDYEADTSNWNRIYMNVTGSSGNATITTDSSGTGAVGNLYLGTNSNQSTLTILDSGNVGIGYNDPQTLLHLNKSTGAIIRLQSQINNTEGGLYGGVEWYNTDPSTYGPQVVSNIMSYQADSLGRGGYITFGTTQGYYEANPIERMRITSGGKLLIGKTVESFSTAGWSFASDGSNVFADGVAAISMNRGGADGNIIQFFKSNTLVGKIICNAASVTYSTISDYRLKEDLQDFAGLDMVSKIPVYDFKWKTNKNRSYGVMAHELQEILPEVVSGIKDEEEMQGVDYGRITPILIKAIQELKADNDSLKARIETLENN